MDVFEPRGPGALTPRGTFTANPVSMRAGSAALEALDAAAIGGSTRSATLCTGLLALGYAVAGRGSLLRIHVDDYVALWWRLYREGVLISVSGLACVCTPMDETVIERALVAFERALR